MVTRALQDRQNFSTARGLAAPTPKSLAYTQKEADPAKIMTGLMKQDNPYMEQAATAGRQEAQRRGLLSSSMAVGAAQDSQIRAAAPLAQQSASQGFQHNLSNQGFRQDQTLQTDRLSSDQYIQGRDIESRELQQLRDIESREGLAAAQRSLDLQMQKLGLTAQEQAQLRDIASREGMAAAQRALDRQMQKLGLDAQAQAQLRDIASREGMAAADRALTLETQKRDLAQKTTQADLDRKFQASLAKMNLTATQREQITGAMANYQNTYEQALSAINSNKDLSSTARSNAISSLSARRDNYMNLLGEIYDVDISWPKASENLKPVVKAASQALKDKLPSPTQLAAQVVSGTTGGSRGDRL